jgi:Bacterial Ig-like domain (group 1)/PKD domain
MMLTGSKRMTLLAALIVAAVAAACDKAQLVAPSESSISVSTAATSVSLGGSTEISAFVMEQAGTPVHNGTTVRFATTLGTVNPVEAQTRNGVATTTFSAGNASGTARITATSGPATTETPVEITVGAAAASNVQVTATPSSVPLTGGTVTVVASATDAAGNRLVGVPVTFSTTNGTLSSTTATTDANGEARVQLTANGPATVTARVGAQTGTASITQATATSVTVTTTPNPSAAGNPVTLTVTPAAGTAPTVSIEWGDGTTQNLGTVAAARSVTHVYSSPGIYTITANATGQGGDTFSTSITQTVTSRPAPTVTAAPNPATTAQTVTFTITPAAGTSPTNVAIDFGDGTSMNLGGITGPATVGHRYTSAGIYTVRVTQTDNVGTSAPAVLVVTVNPVP